jgi:PAS domain S-box-containing protein
MPERLSNRLGLLLLFAVVYALAVQASLAYVMQPEGLSAMWLPSGLVLGVLLRRRGTEWPAIIAVALAIGVAGNMRTESWSLALLYNFANLVEGVISALLIRALTGPHPRLDRLREVFALALIPALVGEPISAWIATFGQSVLLGPGDFWHVWGVWWSSATLGEMIAAPVVLTLPAVWRPPTRAAWRRIGELAGFTAATAVLSTLVFSRGLSAESGPPLGWITFPLIAFAAVRVGPVGAAVPAAAYGLISAWNTIHGHGPFASLAANPADRALWLNLFLGFTVFASLMLAAADAEYRRAVVALRASEAKFRSIFENAADAIFRITEDGHYADANPATARMLGYDSPEQLIAEVGNVAELYVDPRRRVELLERLRAEHELPAVELEVRRRDGSTAWWSMALRAVTNEADRIEYVEGVAEDITARRESQSRAEHLQRQLLQAQKMESLGTLARGIAHDFNNILAAIVGMIDLARLALPPEHPARRPITDALRATERASELVLQVLTFSQQHTEERWPENVAPIAGEVAKLMRAALPASIDIRTSLPADLPPVLANATQIHQVLVNLMTNAGHAMRDAGGELRLELDVVTPDAALRAEVPALRDVTYVRITVSDTGHGMDPHTVARIFEPFFTTKEPGEGTGLGLAMVHGIVDRHDGAVTVQSAVGVGSVFQVYLPALEAQKPSEAAVEMPVVRGRGEHILFVDDEPMLARVGNLFLADLGYRVTAHTNPGEALAAFRAAPDDFDLVVTDLTMPGTSGLDLADEMHLLRPDVPIVLTTGFRGSLTDEMVRAHGIRGTLLKPYAGAHLATVVAGLLHGNAPER